MNTEDMTANNARLEANRSANSRRPSRRGRSRGAMGLLAVVGTTAWRISGAALPSPQQVRQRRAVTVPRPLTRLRDPSRAAALDALAHARHITATRDRGRLRVGAFFRVTAGFSDTEGLTQERPLSAFASRGGGVQVLSG